VKLRYRACYVRIMIFMVCVSIWHPASAHGQNAPQDPSGGPPILKVDLASGTFDKTVPFDQPFYITIAAAGSSKITGGTLMYGYTRRRNDTTEDKISETVDRMVKPVGGNAMAAGGISFRIKPLETNRYCLFVLALDIVIDTQTEHLTINVAARTTAAIADYVRSDIGLVWAPQLLQGITPRPQYYGASSSVHIYLKAVNDQSEAEDISGWQNNILKRVSLLVGLVLFDIRSDVPIDHMYSAGTPVLGLSVRPLLPNNCPIVEHFHPINSLYFSGGMMYFNQKDADSLLTKEHGKRSMFFQLGGVVDWKNLLSPLAFLFGGAKS
jgi:hypothetical protein